MERPRKAIETFSLRSRLLIWDVHAFEATGVTGEKAAVYESRRFDDTGYLVWAMLWDKHCTEKHSDTIFDGCSHPKGRMKGLDQSPVLVFS